MSCLKFYFYWIEFIILDHSSTVLFLSRHYSFMKPYTKLKWRMKSCNQQTGVELCMAEWINYVWTLPLTVSLKASQPNSLTSCETSFSVSGNIVILTNVKSFSNSVCECVAWGISLGDLASPALSAFFYIIQLFLMSMTVKSLTWYKKQQQNLKGLTSVKKKK